MRRRPGGLGGRSPHILLSYALKPSKCVSPRISVAYHRNPDFSLGSSNSTCQYGLVLGVHFRFRATVGQ